MKLESINHGSPYNLPDEVTSLILTGNGVKVSIIERGRNIDVRVDPIGSDFVSDLEYEEVSANETQARLSVHGRDMRDNARKLRQWVAAILSDTADKVAHGRYADPQGETEEVLSQLIRAVQEGTDGA